VNLIGNLIIKILLIVKKLWLIVTFTENEIFNVAQHDTAETARRSSMARWLQDDVGLTPHH